MNLRIISVCAAAAMLMVSPRPSRAQTLETVMVQVDADTSLATDVWLPSVDAPDGGWPVILRRTPYRRAMEASDVAGFSNLGYVFVSQDIRGSGGSEGDFLPFLTDAADGRAAIEWAATQPWSNGKVCTWGGSAEGVVQLMAAGEAPEGLACVISLVSTDDVYDGMVRGGVWRQELTTDWLKALNAPDVLAEWRAHEGAGPYWDRGRLTADERARIHVPMMLLGGFFDIFAHDELRMHRDFRHEVAPESRGDQYLVMGPWTHGGVNFDADQKVKEGEVEYIRGISNDLMYLEFINFLDWALKDGDRPAWAPLRYFRTRLSDDGFSAAGTWRTLDEWPPEGREATLYAGSGGTLAAEPSGLTGDWVSIPVNPLDPVPSRGGNNLTIPAGPHDQNPVDSRDDVMVFETAPVDSDTFVEGDVAAVLRVAFSGDDGDVIVRLSQVTPGGAAILLADGAVRARFLVDPAVPSPVVPGQAYDITVPLSPVAVELPAGHALRISVSGTSATRYEVNPGRFAPLSEPVEPVAGTMKVDAAASSIVLNVTKGDAWKPADEPVVVADSGCAATGTGNPLGIALLAALASVLLCCHRFRRAVPAGVVQSLEGDVVDDGDHVQGQYR